MRNCHRTTLLTGIKWRSIRCSSCRVSSTSAKWLCKCDLHWYVCPEHAPQGHAAHLVKVPRTVVAHVGASQSTEPPVDMQLGKRRRLDPPPPIPIPKRNVNGPSKRRLSNANSKEGPLKRSRGINRTQQAIDSIERMRASREKPLDPGDQGLI